MVTSEFTTYDAFPYMSDTVSVLLPLKSVLSRSRSELFFLTDHYSPSNGQVFFNWPYSCGVSNASEISAGSGASKEVKLPQLHAISFTSLVLSVVRPSGMSLDFYVCCLGVCNLGSCLPCVPVFIWACGEGLLLGWWLPWWAWEELGQNLSSPVCCCLCPPSWGADELLLHSLMPAFAPLLVITYPCSMLHPVSLTLKASAALTGMYLSTFLH